MDINQFRPVVYALALKVLRNPDEAEDVVQDVMVQVLRKRHQLRQPERIAGWIKTMAINFAINRLKRRKLVQLNEHADSTPEPVDQMIQEEEEVRLREALMSMRPIYREALDGFYLRGLSIKELAVEMGAPEGTIKRRLSVGWQRLALLAA